ncbi:IclR family transcriptional regulator, partial [Rhodococcus sp. NPDC057014]
ALALTVPNDDNAYAQIPALLAAARGISRTVRASLAPTE